MKNNEAVRIAIAETSVIIRGGLTAALKRLPNVKVQPIELLSVEALNDCLRTQYPEMLIVNPAFGDYFDYHCNPDDCTEKMGILQLGRGKQYGRQHESKRELYESFNPCNLDSCIHYDAGTFYMDDFNRV